jgi:hypothetical protein
MLQAKPYKDARNRKGEQGVVLAFAAFGMLAFILAAGLAIDISHMYTAKAGLQNAADASALAGAGRLDMTSQGIDRAVSDATSRMNSYDFKNEVNVNPSQITFAVNKDGPYMTADQAKTMADKIRYVKVGLPDNPVGMSLSSLVLEKEQQLNVKAVAGLSVDPCLQSNVLCDINTPPSEEPGEPNTPPDADDPCNPVLNGKPLKPNFGGKPFMGGTTSSLPAGLYRRIPVLYE